MFLRNREMGRTGKIACICHKAHVFYISIHRAHITLQKSEKREIKFGEVDKSTYLISIPRRGIELGQHNILHHIGQFLNLLWCPNTLDHIDFNKRHDDVLILNAKMLSSWTERINVYM